MNKGTYFYESVSIDKRILTELQKLIVCVHQVNHFQLNCRRAALPYRGKFAKISGVDSKGTRHDHNVICHVIKKILKKTDGRNIVVNAFADYLSAYNSNELSNVISEFLQDTELTKLLISLLSEMK